MVREMFDLMYQAEGIGLAANQVDLPYRLFVLNITGDADQAEQERVFINPVILSSKGSAEAEEGCLSLPGIYGDVKRPERVVVNAFGIDGQEFRQELDGLAARATQHEIDHLDGVLFIDRLPETKLMAIRDQINELEVNYLSQRERGELPTDAEIASRLADLERVRT